MYLNWIGYCRLGLDGGNGVAAIANGTIKWNFAVFVRLECVYGDLRIRKYYKCAMYNALFDFKFMLAMVQSVQIIFVGYRRVLSRRAHKQY